MNKPSPFVIQRYQNTYPYSFTNIDRLYYCDDSNDQNVSISEDKILEIDQGYNFERVITSSITMEYSFTPLTWGIVRVFISIKACYTQTVLSHDTVVKLDKLIIGQFGCLSIQKLSTIIFDSII